MLFSRRVMIGSPPVLAPSAMDGFGLQWSQVAVAAARASSGRRHRPSKQRPPPQSLDGCSAERHVRCATDRPAGGATGKYTTSGESSRRRERRLLSLCYDGGARGIPGRVTCRGRLRLEQRHRVDRDGRDDRDDGVDDEALRRVGVVRGAALLGPAGLWRCRRGRESQGPSPRIYMYTPLVGSGELDHESRHVVPRPQPQRTSNQLRAAF